jgi:hypothetical protein
MADLAPPPSGAPQVTIVPAKPTPGIKMPGEIHIGGTPSTSTVPEPPKPGSAKEALGKRLAEKGAKPPTPETPPAPATPQTPKPGEVPTGAKPPETPAAAAPETTETPAVDPKTGKPPKESPWKIIDGYKERLAKAERALLEAGKGGIPKEVQERITKAEARAKELEDEIRFVNYEKSPEFKTKYGDPYDAAWKRAVAEVSEIPVNDNGASRPATSQDILDLVNLPLGAARSLANERFGEFADDVMAHRKEIRGLFDQRQAALEEARKTGTQREQELQQQRQANQEKIVGEIKTEWQKANDEALADEKNGSFFKPIEGDEHWNQRLAKGFELVDRAFSENPEAPNLTPEQRKSIVRRHAAVRNRAAAFGPMKHKISTLETKLAELTKELEQFKGSEPAAGGRQPSNGAQEPASAKQSVFGKLRTLGAK